MMRRLRDAALIVAVLFALFVIDGSGSTTDRRERSCIYVLRYIRFFEDETRTRKKAFAKKK